MTLFVVLAAVMFFIMGVVGITVFFVDRNESPPFSPFSNPPAPRKPRQHLGYTQEEWDLIKVDPREWAKQAEQLATREFYGQDQQQVTFRPAMDRPSKNMQEWNHARSLLHDLDTRIRAIDSYRYELTRVAGGPEVVIKLRHYQDLSARLRAERHEVYRGILAITERTAHDVMVLDTDWEYTPIQKSEGKYSQYVDGVGLVSSDTPEKLARAVEVVKDDHRTMRALSRGMITRNEARALTEGSISYLIPGEIEANLRLFAKDY